MRQQILICYSGSEDAERAVDTAAALLGPPKAVVLAAAPAMTLAERAAAGSRGLGGFRELAGGSVWHDVATPARRPVLIVPPVTS